MQTMEGQFDSCTEQLFEVSLKLEEKEKAYNNTEGDVGGLSRRALLLEEDVERSESVWLKRSLSWLNNPTELTTP